MSPAPSYPPGSYPALVVADGATHYWRLDETSGTTAVDVIGGANGTISGGVTLNQPGALLPDPPPTTARSGKARAGASRANYLVAAAATSKIPAISIGGVLTGAGASRRVLVASLTIHDQLNEVPNTCTFTVQGDRPLEGAEIVIAYDTIGNPDRLFAGTILRVTQLYVAQRPANVLWQVEGIDYTWELNRRMLVAQYANQSASAIAADLVATWAPAGAGFTTAIEANLPVLDTISFTNTALMDALAQLATRIGGYAACDYFKRIALWITPTGTPPADLTPTHPSLQEFQVTRDLSPVVTRALVEGGGVTAIALVALGETRLPVDDTTWYTPTGGRVVSGPQRLTYTALEPGGGGALIGTGTATPAAAPTVTVAAGAGLPTGTYRYAYTWVTASGETTPSPVKAATTTGGIADPALAPIYVQTGTKSGSCVPGGTYHVKYAWGTGPVGDYTAGKPITMLSPASPNLVATAQGGLAAYAKGTNTPGVTVVYLFRTTNNGSTYYYESYQPNDGITHDLYFKDADLFTDAALAGRLPAPTANSTTIAKVTVAGVSAGPGGTTARKVYRTAVNAAVLKLLATLNDNTTTSLGIDTTADAALGVTAPATDTAGLVSTAGQVNAGSTSIPVMGTGIFGATGWARVASQVIRYTGATGSALTGIPASGPGSLTATISYGSEILVAPQIIGIPASGPGSIRYPILPGDPVNLLVILDDPGAQAALAALLGGDGVVEEYQQDNRIGGGEALARAQALLELKGPILETYRYRTRDPLTKSGRTITVALPAPTNVSGTYEIQDVTIAGFLGTDQYPFYDAVASSRRFTFEDLLRRRRNAAIVGSGV